jgi:hypothetical protein
MQTAQSSMTSCWPSKNWLRTVSGTVGHRCGCAPSRRRRPRSRPRRHGLRMVAHLTVDRGWTVAGDRKHVWAFLTAG